MSVEKQKTITVINEQGLHARPSAMLVQLASQFSAELFVRRMDDDEEVNAKSIMGVMMLAAGHGTELCFKTVGEDGEKLLAEIEKLFKTKFNEE